METAIVHDGDDLYTIGDHFDQGGEIDMHELVKCFSKFHGNEDPFYIINLGDVERQYHKFKSYLPRVTPFYAVKCNPNPKIIKTLWSLGAKFDVASRQEMMLVNDVVFGNATLSDEESKKFHTSSMIFANPCKQFSHIRHAEQVGVKMIVVDSVTEIGKMQKVYPDADLVIRIKVDDSHSICKFSSKFGADLSICPELLKTASDLGMNVVGISFHVGSGCQDASSFVSAVHRAKSVFDMALEYGYKFSLLDIGGGFNGDTYSTPSFEEVADSIRDLLDELFDETVNIIAEPGRYFAKKSHTLVCSVIAKKTHSSSDEVNNHIYINDGVYGSFNCTMFDHFVIKYDRDIGHIPDHLLYEREADAGSPCNVDYVPTTLFGPTCDSMDKICEFEPMPNVDVGDIMYFKQFGAYTVSASTAFNGFLTQKFYYIRK